MYLIILCVALLLFSPAGVAEDLSECMSAQAAKRAGLYSKALNLYNKCIRQGELTSQSKAVAHNNRGNILMDQGAINKAIKEFELAMQLNPDFSKPYSNRGIAYQEKGLYRQASSDYKRAIELNPAHVNAYNNLAWIRATCPVRDLRDGDEAIKLATRVNDLTNWSNPSHLDTLAAAHAESGDFEKAMEYQQKVLTMIAADEMSPEYERMQLYQQNKPYREIRAGSRGV